MKNLVIATSALTGAISANVSGVYLYQHLTHKEEIPLKSSEVHITEPKKEIAVQLHNQIKLEASMPIKNDEKVQEQAADPISSFLSKPLLTKKNQPLVARVMAIFPKGVASRREGLLVRDPDWSVTRTKLTKEFGQEVYVADIESIALKDQWANQSVIDTETIKPNWATALSVWNEWVKNWDSAADEPSSELFWSGLINSEPDKQPYLSLFKQFKDKWHNFIIELNEGESFKEVSELVKKLDELREIN
ncbi:hypothetical protein MHLP_02260 [Candidatus Mycoplasma haematolamae str. Purdue]|uniref:Uncharacterized protein n=1 Tax=Mycoplasma haematolamae (strain Purdue) TaxID=1212765 RepID=I7C6A8_MYCHA|nr:hypothetical protein [Candidatus Mycoplasma haematolamae]AFO52032.1 hypothetical protein MHLP_02260 [Candidatus Mycoplasma haematolamae str. Purdue]